MKYKVTLSKLFQKKEETLDQNRTFFCSELVALAYKQLKLLPSDVASAQYWPGAFSTEKSLPLVGATLGEELTLDFTLNI